MSMIVTPRSMIVCGTAMNSWAHGLVAIGSPSFGPYGSG